MLIPLSGIRHYVEDPDAWCASLREDEKVTLVREDGNPYDAFAIQVWHRARLIGYIDADYCDMVRSVWPEEEVFRAALYEDDLGLDKGDMVVDIPIENPYLPDLYSQLDHSPIGGLALPNSGTCHLMRMLDCLDELSGLIDKENEGRFEGSDFEQAHDLAQRFISDFGKSLSAEDRVVYLGLLSLLKCIMFRNSPVAEDLQVNMVDIVAIRKEYLGDKDACYAVMQSEMAALEESAATFLANYRTRLHNYQVTVSRETAAIDRWLRNLPFDLYSVLDSEQELALRLLYARFSTADLHALYLHLICRRILNELALEKTEKGRRRLNHFTFWGGNPSRSEQRGAVKSMQKAAERSVKDLAIEISRLQKSRILAAELKPRTTFITQLSNLLATPIHYSSLVKYL